jgi:hypothetical protein
VTFVQHFFDSIDRLLIAGMHTHFPAFAHIVRNGATYELIPEVWSSEF